MARTIKNTTKTAASKTATKGRRTKKVNAEADRSQDYNAEWVNQPYPDTEGMELTDDQHDSQEEQVAADVAEIAASKEKVAKPRTPKAPKAPREYTGEPVPATRLYRRRMEEFKNCIAFAWMLLNTEAGTVTYANSYGQQTDATMPRSSWNPAHYTHPIVEKVLAKKMEVYQEVEDREEWPTWVTSALPAKTAEKTAAKRTRKGK